VVVPTPDALADKDASAVKGLITESLKEIAGRSGLRPYEVPRDLLIEPEQFSFENGLLSDTRKPLRLRFRERYGARLEQLCRDLDERQERQLRALHDHDGPIIETLCRAAEALLGNTTRKITPELHLTELGGDSLSALTFSGLLRTSLGIDVPVGFILGSTNNLRKIADYIEINRKSAARLPTAASVHGESSNQIRAGDLQLGKFFAATEITTARSRLTPHGGPGRVVLLTGANGYLGRFLALEWLERLATDNGKLICLVRAADRRKARQRLEKSFTGSDLELAARFGELAANHLEVVVGDIGEPHLGVGEARWRELADTVDVIVHAAAFVNHVLPYAQLFGPNVVGTAEVIRLALTGRTKPVSFVSTLGVADQRDPDGNDERSDIRVVSPARCLTADYANGYVSSKWAAEVLLRQAHEQFALPVRVFRCGMILAHRRYTGQLNVGDVFTRLLLTLIESGIAPKSFYRLDRDGRRRRAHYDGLPVDYVAKALVTLGARARSGYQTYHVSNPHDDGVGLDQFVDWLVAAGYPIARLDDYGEWFTRMATALRALPEDRRQHTLAPVVAAYRRPSSAAAGLRLCTSVFEAASRAVSITPDRDIPHISPGFIEKYATDLQQLGLLRAADRNEHSRAVSRP
jgi:fatty acid CoA ligase FadD9